MSIVMWCVSAMNFFWPSRVGLLSNRQPTSLGVTRKAPPPTRQRGAADDPPTPRRVDYVPVAVVMMLGAPFALSVNTTYASPPKLTALRPYFVCSGALTPLPFDVPEIR